MGVEPVLDRCGTVIDSQVGALQRIFVLCAEADAPFLASTWDIDVRSLESIQGKRNRLCY